MHRYLGHINSYACNKVKLQGLIAKGYISKKCLTFCARYLEGIKIRFNCVRHINSQLNGMECGKWY